MPHVLIPDNVHQSAVELLQNNERLTVSAPGKLTPEELLTQIKEANALVIRSGVQITAEVLAAAPNLHVIARAGVGVDNIDLEAATEHGVVVMNTPGGNTISTAEHTIALMLALARHIPLGDASLKAGRWDRKQFMGIELKGKTLGLIGFGRIGQAVAKRALAFEMRVIAYDPFLDDATFLANGVERAGIDELYKRADFISLHSSLTDDTHSMIDQSALALMKDGVRIINTARGALINEYDLAEAIKSGKIAGAALDVYVEEPPNGNHPLIGLNHVIDTPHLAASTVDAQITVALEAAQLVANALLNNRFENVVNSAVLRRLAQS